MNYSIIVYILGWIMNVEAVCMLVPGITALIYREKAGIAFLITILACLAVGVPLVSRKPTKKAFYAREGLVNSTQLDRPQYCRCCAFCAQQSYTQPY